MEYVEGRTLRDVLQTEGRLHCRERAARSPPASARRWTTATGAGIIHRDIKPANVMLTPRRRGQGDGLRHRPRASPTAAATMTQTAAVIGTAQYLSPEQARGEQVDARSDLYSTGCLLYELLTGRPPFVGDSPVAVAYQHVREDAAPAVARRRPTPAGVDAIVMKALAKNPDNRYQSAAEMRADIDPRAGRAAGAARRRCCSSSADQGLRAGGAETAMAVRPARRTHPILRGLVYLLLFGAVGAVVFPGVVRATQVLRRRHHDQRRRRCPTSSGLTKDAAIDQLLQEHFVPDAQTGNSNKPVGTVSHSPRWRWPRRRPAAPSRSRRASVRRWCPSRRPGTEPCRGQDQVERQPLRWSARSA